MKKKTIYIIISFLSILGAIGYYFSSRMVTTDYYNKICGSGLNGMRVYMMHYLPFILIIAFIVFVFIRYNQSRCPICKSEIEEDFNTCPFCGTTVEKRGE